MRARGSRTVKIGKLAAVLVAAIVGGPVALVIDVGVAQAALPRCSQYLTVRTPGPVDVNRLLDRHIPSTQYEGGSTDCTLARYNRGLAVTVLQEALVYCAGQNISIDGDFGTNTRNALLNVQGSAGIYADGLYGPDTRRVMRWPWYDMAERRIVGGSYCSSVG